MNIRELSAPIKGGIVGIAIPLAALLMWPVIEDTPLAILAYPLVGGLMGFTFGGPLQGIVTLAMAVGFCFVTGAFVGAIIGTFKHSPRKTIVGLVLVALFIVLLVVSSSREKQQGDEQYWKQMHEQYDRYVDNPAGCDEIRSVQCAEMVGKFSQSIEKCVQIGDGALAFDCFELIDDSQFSTEKCRGISDDETKWACFVNAAEKFDDERFCDEVPVETTAFGLSQSWCKALIRSP